MPLSSLKDRAHRSEAFRVPLSGRAVEIVHEMGEARVGDFVFPGRQSRQPLSRATILSFLKSMNDGDAPRWLDPVRGRSVSPHGFRASLKTWCEEASTFPHAVVEMALGHQVGNAVERAYRRTDLLEQRRKLMSAWSEYVEGSESANVVRLRA